MNININQKPRLTPVSDLPERTAQSSMMTMQPNAVSRFAEGAEAEREQRRLAAEMGRQLFAGKKLVPVRTHAAP
jgi:hypothetical protein